jgi:hypothetical protein
MISKIDLGSHVQYAQELLEAINKVEPTNLTVEDIFKIAIESLSETLVGEQLKLSIPMLKVWKGSNECRNKLPTDAKKT